jgi:LPXTG-motif cell wall-anchored protein
VHGWAFEDSGAGIVAGETGASNPVPGLGGLAALACGAAGLRRKRDRVA